MTTQICGLPPPPDTSEPARAKTAGTRAQTNKRCKRNENPMARRTYARFGSDNSMQNLKKKNIPATARGLLKAGTSAPDVPDLLTQNGYVQGNSLIVPNNEYLELIGTTGELQQLANRLTKAGIHEIKCKPNNQLAAWCVRVDADHPDHVMSSSTLTLLVIGAATAFGGTIDPAPPWNWFGVVRKGVLMKLDDFDAALEDAKEYDIVN
jgi:hypothetical protein